MTIMGNTMGSHKPGAQKTISNFTEQDNIPGCNKKTSQMIARI